MSAENSNSSRKKNVFLTCQHFRKSYERVLVYFNSKLQSSISSPKCTVFNGDLSKNDIDSKEYRANLQQLGEQLLSHDNHDADGNSLNIPGPRAPAISYKCTQVVLCSLGRALHIADADVQPANLHNINLQKCTINKSIQDL